MYTSYYNLKEKPFQISSDPKFMWLGEKHKEALATLKYGIQDNKGFLLLTGDVGTGKTTLINSLLNSLDDNVRVAVIHDPGLELMDFFNYVAYVFGINRMFTTKIEFLICFTEFLHSTHEKNEQVMLIIDESQRLTSELLEEIRLLSNIELQNRKLLNIFFAGQNEFNDILIEERNRSVRQRLTLNYNIDPLSVGETAHYIQHRLKVAGTTEILFDTGAIANIHAYSGGFPRHINIICDHALLFGYVNEQRMIDAKTIDECARELKISKRIDTPSAGNAAKGNKPEPRLTTGVMMTLLFLFIGILSCGYLLYQNDVTISIHKGSEGTEAPGPNQNNNTFFFKIPAKN